MKILLVSTFLLGLPAAASAQAIITTGHGLDLCSDLVQSRVLGANVETSYFDWAQGYMSGVNTMLGTAKAPTHNLNAKSDAAQKKMLLDYCTAHPTEPYQSAVVKMLFTFPSVPAEK